VRLSIVPALNLCPAYEQSMQTTATIEGETAPHRATRREWIGLAIIALPCILYSMDLTVLHLAVPALTTELAPSSAQLLWIIDIYGFLVAGSLITMGTLGDRIGRRRLLMIGAAAFGVASLLAAFSTSANTLIASRAILGVAGATVAPSTLSLIRNMFLDPHERTVAVSVWITSYSIGGAIGPLIGGLLLQMFWWGSVFLISVPVMLLLLITAPRLLPEYRDPSPGRLDLTSAAMSLLSVLSVIYGLKQIAQGGVSLAALVTIGIGVMLAILFRRRQLRLESPLVDLRLFREPGFSTSLATYGLSILVMFGGFLFLPQYLQLVMGLSPLVAGLWTIPWAMAFVVGATVLPALARRVRPAYLMAGGLVLSAVGFAMFTMIDRATSFAWFATGSSIFSLGMVPVFTLTTDLIIGTAPPERAGAASAMSETSAELGGALGIALFGSIGVALYRLAIADGIPLSLSASDAAAARATLGGALAAARQIPAAEGAMLIDAGRGAFISALQFCAGISAAGSLVLAVFVLAAMKHVRRPG
jgi:DHA2 family multidrug resistance protein-like MFS transporter